MKGSQEHKMANRRDHYLPQGYLRGFIDPDESPSTTLALGYSDRELGQRKAPSRWVMKTAFTIMRVRHENLFHPDIAFAKLEREFPVVRDRLINTKFEGWAGELEFLLSYMQMMRARSPLLLAQKATENRAVRGWTVKAVGPGPNELTLESIEAAPMPETWVRNRTIVQMREEVDKDPAWMREFHWCLRYTESPYDPVITAEQPLVCATPPNNPVDALHDPDTLIYFPLCWQAYLIGSVRRVQRRDGQICPRITALGTEAVPR